VTKEEIYEIIKKEDLLQYNIFDDHPQEGNEVILKNENGQYVVYMTSEDNKIKDNIYKFSDINEAINIFIDQLKILKRYYFSLFIGNNYNEYYKEILENGKSKKYFFNWNWPAFLLTFYWLSYRKMYLEVLIILFLALYLKLLYCLIVILPIMLNLKF